jgi:hypothetical protein
MSHRRLRARLGPYLEGDLAPGERRRVEAHLSHCAACRAELAALRRTVRLLRDLPPVETPPGLGERILAGLEDAPRSGLGAWLQHHRGLLSTAVPVAAGLALAVAVLPRIQISVRLGPGLRAAAPVVAEAAPPSPRAETAVRRVRAGGPAAPRAESPAPPRATAFAGPPLPLPPRTACLDAQRARTPECARWHAWMVGLAMRDPSAFAVEMDRLPSEQQERWIRELSSFAADAGAASLLATELRASGDPRAARLAPRFERVSVFAGRRR